MPRYAYNTNGLAHHRLEEAVELVADLGYDGLALTPDVGHLDPQRVRPAELEALRAACARFGLAVGVESGARFLLDPRRKHAPNLMSDDADGRARRVELYRAHVRIAAALGGEYLSIWSGGSECGTTAESTADPRRREALWVRLTEGVRATLDAAEEHGVELCFEPEPGMFVERPTGFDELVGRLGSDGARLRLTLDVGHCVCTDDLPVSAVLERYAAKLGAVHLADIRGRVHRHLPLGEGDLDLADVVRGLDVSGFRGLCSVELSRDSHRGAQAAAEAIETLRAAGR